MIGRQYRTGIYTVGLKKGKEALNKKSWSNFETFTDYYTALRCLKKNMYEGNQMDFRIKQGKYGPDKNHCLLYVEGGRIYENIRTNRR